jgi:hypothetical protein
MSPDRSVALRDEPRPEWRRVASCRSRRATPPRAFRRAPGPSPTPDPLRPRRRPRSRRRPAARRATLTRVQRARVEAGHRHADEPGRAQQGEVVANPPRAERIGRYLDELTRQVFDEAYERPQVSGVEQGRYERPTRPASVTTSTSTSGVLRIAPTAVSAGTADGMSTARTLTERTEGTDVALRRPGAGSEQLDHDLLLRAGRDRSRSAPRGSMWRRR